jgi:hypothetical protein
MVIWVTNCWREDAIRYMRDLKRGFEPDPRFYHFWTFAWRCLFEGRPKATEKHSVQDLCDMGVVGIYEDKPGKQPVGT